MDQPTPAVLGLLGNDAAVLFAVDAMGGRRRAPEPEDRLGRSGNRTRPGRWRGGVDEGGPFK